MENKKRILKHSTVVHCRKLIMLVGLGFPKNEFHWNFHQNKMAALLNVLGEKSFCKPSFQVLMDLKVYNQGRDETPKKTTLLQNNGR